MQRFRPPSFASLLPVKNHAYHGQSSIWPCLVDFVAGLDAQRSNGPIGKTGFNSWDANVSFVQKNFVSACTVQALRPVHCLRTILSQNMKYVVK
jgi:hypothetical protein